MVDLLTAQGRGPATSPALAADYADYVQITNDLPAAVDPYWNGPSATCNAAATYGNCFAQFGSTDQQELNVTRDLRILEAYQDHVEVEARHPFPARSDAKLPPLINLLRCCFPTAITFNVRPGNQWAVVGDQSGFLHHVVADQTTGVCRNNCDGNFQRMNGRLISSATEPHPRPGPAGDRPQPLVHEPDVPLRHRPERVQPATRLHDAPKEHAGHGLHGRRLQTGVCKLARDTVFRFNTTNSFLPLLPVLSTDPSVLVEPTSITYLSATQEVAVTDGSFSGLIMVSLQTGAWSRSFY